MIGADAAGMSAAHQALRTARSHGRQLSVTVLEKTRHTSYSACGIPYWVAGDVDSSDSLSARSVEEHREMGVDLRMRSTAVGIDPDRRLVIYLDGDRRERHEPFDQLVLATGAAAVVPPWATHDDGELIPGVMPLKDLDDGAWWLDRLGRGSHGRGAVVAGGGYIGLEMAEALVRRGWSTTLLTRSGVMSSLDPDMSDRVQQVLESARVEVRTGVAVVGLETRGNGSVRGVVADDGTSHPADVVVLALGAAPATALGGEIGLLLGSSGGYLPDDAGHLGDGIWAAGDCCEARHRVTGEYVFLPLGTHANKQGKVVGCNLGGGEAAFGGVLGTAITRFVAGDHLVEISRTGLNTAEAERAGIEVASLLTHGRTASGYMPEASPMATKVLADPTSRRLLGLQIVGGQGSAKRVDTAAAALWGGLTVDDLAGMDLSYAPPFATVWEAVQLASRRLADRL